MKGETTIDLSPQHPAFPGHFPARPIVPGVVLLDEVLRALEQAQHVAIGHCTIAWAKFRSTAAPGQPLKLSYEQRPDGSITFTIRTPLRIVAEGLITIPPAAAQMPVGLTEPALDGGDIAERSERLDQRHPVAEFLGLLAYV